MKKPYEDKPGKSNFPRFEKFVKKGDGRPERRDRQARSRVSADEETAKKTG